ncbi:hypothetical protein, partial [Methylobacterium sp. WL6]|uniref:hypothetical protein n=1 Tax=Methylobacterium sp. WL6 TaxID=2603901 RepID=UPI001AEDD855
MRGEAERPGSAGSAAAARAFRFAAHRVEDAAPGLGIADREPELQQGRQLAELAGRLCSDLSLSGLSLSGPLRSVPVRSGREGFHGQPEGVGDRLQGMHIVVDHAIGTNVPVGRLPV